MFAAFAQGLAPVVAAIGGGIFASSQGVPQDLPFESTFAFQLLAVLLVAAMVVSVALLGVAAVRDERERN